MPELARMLFTYFVKTDAQPFGLKFEQDHDSYIEISCAYYMQ